MEPKTIEYKGYIIEIHAQPKTGDNIKVFFGVWRSGKKIFGLWEQISGTESRSLNINDVIIILEERGVNNIKKRLDMGDFKEGEKYRILEALRQN